MTKSKRRTGEVVFWAQMNSDIEEMERRCNMLALQRFSAERTNDTAQTIPQYGGECGIPQFQHWN